MRIQFAVDHEEFKAGQFACVTPEMAHDLIKAKKAKEAPPYVPGQPSAKK